MNILFYNNSFLWKNQSIVSLELAERFKKHKIFFLTCEETLFSCAANPKKIKNICKTCLINKDKTLKNLKKQNNFQELILSKKINYYKFNFKIKDFYQLKGIYYKNMPIGELVISQICDSEKSDYLPTEFILRNKDRILKELNSGIELFESAISKINNFKIEKIYAWNGRRPSDGPVLFAAKYKRIPFKTFISNAPKKYFLSRGTKSHDLKDIKRRINNYSKYILKKNINLKKIYKNFILNKINNKIHKTNYGYQKIDSKKGKKISEKNYIVFFTSSAYEFAGFKDWDSKIYLDQYQAIKKLINDKRLRNTKIIIRWHPLLKIAGTIEKKRTEDIIKIKAKNVRHVRFDENISSYNILLNADKVITFGSTIIFEADYFKKPIISLTETPYDDLNFFHKASSHEEAINLIKKKINRKVSILPSTYAALIKSEIFQYKLKKFSYKNNNYYFKNKKIINYTYLDRLRILISKIFHV